VTGTWPCPWHPSTKTSVAEVPPIAPPAAGSPPQGTTGLAGPAARQQRAQAGAAVRPRTAARVCVCVALAVPALFVCVCVRVWACACARACACGCGRGCGRGCVRVRVRGAPGVRTHAADAPPPVPLSGELAHAMAAAAADSPAPPLTRAALATTEAAPARLARMAAPWCCTTPCSAPNAATKAAICAAMVLTCLPMPCIACTSCERSATAPASDAALAAPGARWALLTSNWATSASAHRSRFSLASPTPMPRSGSFWRHTSTHALRMRASTCLPAMCGCGSAGVRVGQGSVKGLSTVCEGSVKGL
jgi:hypothetical protein